LIAVFRVSQYRNRNRPGRNTDWTRRARAALAAFRAYSALFREIELSVTPGDDAIGSGFPAIERPPVSYRARCPR
jgi:hypothetical protein